MPAPELSVILPAYNEGAQLFSNLQRVCEALSACSAEIIVVDDGSRDNTCAEAERAAQRYPGVRVLRLDANHGKGGALFQGVSLARGAFIAFLDADLEIAPEFVLALWAQLRQAGADVAIGARRAATAFPLPRRVLSGLYHQLIGLLFGLELTDTQAGIKLFRREVLDVVASRLRVRRFAFDVEVLVAAFRFGFKVVECPVGVTYERSGQLGRLRVGHALGMLGDTLSIYYRASFWSWLAPGPLTQLWMVAFVAGILAFGMGVAKVLTPLVLQPPLSQIFYIVALQFLPHVWRDWLLVAGGAALVGLSLIQLNKSLLNAFARRDRGDLAGILKKR
jgi:glycosyltransferase involved in cell wall biosynthesis